MSPLQLQSRTGEDRILGRGVSHWVTFISQLQVQIERFVSIFEGHLDHKMFISLDRDRVCMRILSAQVGRITV